MKILAVTLEKCSGCALLIDNEIEIKGKIICDNKELINECKENLKIYKKMGKEKYEIFKKLERSLGI